jgi:hypothetical protein
MSSEHSKHTAFVRWKHTKLGRLVWVIITAVIAYVFASLALDSGALWQWGVAILFAIDALYNLVQLARKFIHHDIPNHTDQA